MRRFAVSSWFEGFARFSWNPRNSHGVPPDAMLHAVQNPARFRACREIRVFKKRSGFPSMNPV